MAAVVAVRATMARAAMQGGLLTHCAPRSAASADLPAGFARLCYPNASGCISLGLFFGLLMNAQAPTVQEPSVLDAYPNDSHCMRKRLVAPGLFTETRRAKRNPTGLSALSGPYKGGDQRFVTQLAAAMPMQRRVEHCADGQGVV